MILKWSFLPGNLKSLSKASSYTGKAVLERTEAKVAAVAAVINIKVYK